MYKNDCVRLVHTTTKEYFNLKEKYDDLELNTRINYSGDLLKEELSKLNDEFSASKAESLTYIENIKNNMFSKIDNEVGTTFNADNLTSDFELLKLPVTLTEQEIRLLNQRNQNNPLFTRALKEYCQTHEISCIGISDTYEERKTAINELCKHTSDIIENDDFDTLRDFEIMGVYERLDSKI